MPTRTTWTISFKGGMFDGSVLQIELFPKPLAFVWPENDPDLTRRGITAVLTFDVEEAQFNALVYRREAMDEQVMQAVYVVGDMAPKQELEEEELVGVGTSSDPMIFSHDEEWH